MLRFTKRMIGLPVQTKSGISLGSVADFGLETDTGHLQKICVKSGGIVKGLMGDELLVDWSQIVEIREDIIIVDDSLAKETGKSLARSVAPTAVAMLNDQTNE